MPRSPLGFRSGSQDHGQVADEFHVESSEPSPDLQPRTSPATKTNLANDPTLQRVHPRQRCLSATSGDSHQYRRNGASMRIECQYSEIRGGRCPEPASRSCEHLPGGAGGVSRGTNWTFTLDRDRHADRLVGPASARRLATSPECGGGWTSQDVNREGEDARMP